MYTIVLRWYMRYCLLKQEDRISDMPIFSNAHILRTSIHIVGTIYLPLPRAIKLPQMVVVISADRSEDDRRTPWLCLRTYTAQKSYLVSTYTDIYLHE